MKSKLLLGAIFCYPIFNLADTLPHADGTFPYSYFLEFQSLITAVSPYKKGFYNVKRRYFRYRLLGLIKLRNFRGKNLSVCNMNGVKIGSVYDSNLRHLSVLQIFTYPPRPWQGSDSISFQYKPLNHVINHMTITDFRSRQN